MLFQSVWTTGVYKSVLHICWFSHFWSTPWELSFFQASGTVYDASITVKGLKSNYSHFFWRWHIIHDDTCIIHKHTHTCARTHTQTHTFDSKLQVPCLLTASQLNKRHQAHMPITYTSIPILTVHLWYMPTTPDPHAYVHSHELLPSQ